MSFKKMKLNYVYFIKQLIFTIKQIESEQLGKLQWKTWALHLQGIVYTESRDS